MPSSSRKVAGSLVVDLSFLNGILRWTEREVYTASAKHLESRQKFDRGPAADATFID